jgi:hypothetical protein
MFLKNNSYKSITFNSLTGKSIETSKIVREIVTFRHNDNSIGEMDVKIRDTNAAKGAMSR